MTERSEGYEHSASEVGTSEAGTSEASIKRVDEGESL